MEKLDIKGYIAKANEICELLKSANVGNNASEEMSLSERFCAELLRFAIYLSDANGKMEEAEKRLIEENLGVKTDGEQLAKEKEKLSANFANEVPSVLKFAVLADAGKKIANDPFHGQKAMVIYDAFGLFGQMLLAVHAKEPDTAESAFYTAYMDRMEKFLREYAVWYSGSQKIYKPIEVITEDPETEEEKAEKLAALLEEFNNMTGLTGVKYQVNSLVNLIKVQKMRKAQGLKVSEVSSHMVFSGNPGTGKTTVARMLAEIYKYLGVLEKGQLIEVDRGGLVRGYVGQTATQTLEVIESALGGILFIDEAYTLTVNKGEGDFGQEAVDTLLKAMEDHRGELIVIVAGYTDLMEQFLASNPGLKSRFSNFIYFEDYTAEELLEILVKNFQKQEYHMSPAAAEKARAVLEELVANKPDNFANARDVRNYMEHAISKHASRIVNLPEAAQSKELLTTIEAEDLD